MEPANSGGPSMTSLSTRLCEIAAKHIIHSNTPRYFFDKLAGDGSLQLLAKESSVQSLISIATAVDQDDDILSDKCLSSYAALVAIFVNAKAGASDLHPLVLLRPKLTNRNTWLLFMISLLLDNYRREQTISHTFTPQSMLRITNSQQMHHSAIRSNSKRFEVGHD